MTCDGGQCRILRCPRKGIDNVKHRAALFEIIRLFHDFGLIPGNLKLTGEGLNRAFRISNRRFGRNHELRLAVTAFGNNTLQYNGKLIHDFARYMPETRINGSFLDKSVSANQPEIVFAVFAELSLFVTPEIQFGLFLAAGISDFSQHLACCPWIPGFTYVNALHLLSFKHACRHKFGSGVLRLKFFQIPQMV